MYIPELAQAVSPGPSADQEPRSSHCWCNCTLTETGPDDRPVGPDHCRQTRSCFEE